MLIKGGFRIMTRSEIIKSYNRNTDPAGRKLNSLSEEELTRIQGGGDVNPETTTLCAFGSGVALTIALSKAFTCGSN
jgi:type 2 lantibiotic (TIGR03893 family)